MLRLRPVGSELAFSSLSGHVFAFAHLILHWPDVPWALSVPSGKARLLRWRSAVWVQERVLPPCPVEVILPCALRCLGLSDSEPGSAGSPRAPPNWPCLGDRRQSLSQPHSESVGGPAPQESLLCGPCCKCRAFRSHEFSWKSKCEVFFAGWQRGTGRPAEAQAASQGAGPLSPGNHSRCILSWGDLVAR